MKFVRSSSLQEYARKFWVRQTCKATEDDRPALNDIRNGGDPIKWLANIYPYKLPNPRNSRIQILTIESVTEAEGIFIHFKMLTDAWTTDRCLKPCPKSRRIGDMVTTALKRGYFDSDRSDTQLKLFKKWSSKNSLDGFFGEQNLPMIELTWPDQYEIVDGWGRLHAYLALVRAGLPFLPFSSFVASLE